MGDRTSDLTSAGLALQETAAKLQAVTGITERSVDGPLLSLLLAKPGGQAAVALLNQFQSKPVQNGRGFPFLKRADVARELFERLLRPSRIDQGAAGLCGPAAFLFETVCAQPHEYAKFAVDLFETGQAHLGSLEVKPCQSLRQAQKPAHVGSLDWLMLASLRNSENLLFTYASPTDQFSGLTLPCEVAAWFRALGYTKVENETDLLLSFNNEATLQKINTLFSAGARVLLLINSNLVNGADFIRGSTVPDHWVALMSKIDMTNRSRIRFTVYTWGNPSHPIPQPGCGKSLELKMLLSNLYGYVAGWH